jgi:hypothetical protein
MNEMKARHRPSLLYRVAVLTLPLSLIYGVFMAVYRLLNTPLNSAELDSSYLILVLQVLVIAPMAVVIGFLIMRRSPGNIIGPLIVHYGFATTPSGGFTIADSFLAPLIQFHTQAVFLNVIILILFYFPTGDTAFRGTARVVNVFILVAPIYSVVNIMASPVLTPGLPPNPYHVPDLAPLASLLPGLYGVTLSSVMLMAITAVVLRYRAAEGRERAQIRWLALAAYTFLLIAAGWMALGFMPGGMVAAMESDFGWLVQFISITWFLVAIPLAVGLAILRHNLYDIDLIINRTLVYVPLTGIVAGLYSASVALFQRLFQALTGESSDGAIVMATLILASLFTPLKNTLQSFVDKRFKEAPHHTKDLQAFGDHVRVVGHVVDLDARQVSSRLLEEAVSAFHSQGGAVYLGKDGMLELIHTSGNGISLEDGGTEADNEDGDAGMSVHLESNGEQLGLLSLGAHENGGGYTKHDHEVLQQVADQVSQVIMKEKAVVDGLMVTAG